MPPPLSLNITTISRSQRLTAAENSRVIPTRMARVATNESNEFFIISWVSYRQISLSFPILLVTNLLTDCAILYQSTPSRKFVASDVVTGTVHAIASFDLRIL